jgi:hypothetical protein
MANRAGMSVRGLPQELARAVLAVKRDVVLPCEKGNGFTGRAEDVLMRFRR